MRPTIEAAFNRGIVITSHRFCRHECRDCPAVDLAVMIERTVQGYQHVLVGAIVAHAPDEAASGDVCAIKKFQIDFTAVFDIDALCLRCRAGAKGDDSRDSVQSHFISGRVSVDLPQEP